MNREDFRWFKETFHQPIAEAIAHTPFSLDLLAAIAAQETGHIWGSLRSQLTVAEVLEVCVGDTLDADKGRRAFPKTKTDLIAAARGEEMFQIAREALVHMAGRIPAFAGVAKRPNKFCHGFGIFQYDIQFFKTDPDYFLERRWRRFDAALGKCLDELFAAAKRIGFRLHPPAPGRAVTANPPEKLPDLDQVHIAIAYNCGTFKPSKGLQQGHFDGKQFYGEKILDFLRTSQTVAIGDEAASIPNPQPGFAALATPTAVLAVGATFQVNVESAPLRLRSEPRIDRARPSANVIAHLPDGHLVRAISGKPSDKFLEVETSLHGAHLRGFAATQFLQRVEDDLLIPVTAPETAIPEGGVTAVFAPRKSGTITKRTALANALSLNEPDQPARTGASPEQLREELFAIIDYLAVDRAAHLRYQPRSGVTFCNIYAHDYCHLAGVYLPRVWWTPDAIERLTQGDAVEPRLGGTIDEQRANDLFRWLRAFGSRFGWRQTGTLTKLQTEVNLGAIGLIIARRKLDGKSGHVVVVAPEGPEQRARRDAAGEVIAPLQSQAGVRNFCFGTGTANWWNGEQFAESALWVHA